MTYGYEFRDPNPNLVVVLHYFIKLMWIVLSIFFGYLGFSLYNTGVQQFGDAEVNIFSIKFWLGNAGPGLIVMIFCLCCTLIGIVTSKVEFRPYHTKAGEYIPVHKNIFKNNLANNDRECFLFSALCEILASIGSNPFIITNSHNIIDIRSANVGAIPDNIVEKALLISVDINKTNGLQSHQTEIDGWKLTFIMISPEPKNDTLKWNLIKFEPQKNDIKQIVYSLDTKPLISY